MIDINEWPIIKHLNKDFVKTIKFVFIYCSGKSVICVSNDDMVYSFGCNTSGYLGLGHQNQVNEPKIVENLCSKRVIDIKIGANSILALTKSGAIYSWGVNEYGQLGLGDTFDCYRPSIVADLINRRVIDIKCGKYHCLALTQNGEVFEWGLNASGEEIIFPIAVTGLRFETIVSITCGGFHSLALTENGDVFSWGENSKGQLGIANFTNRCEPIKIDALNGDKIVKVSCGAYHSMLLTESGDIYFFGANDFGQRGDDCRDKTSIPIKLNIAIKFVDIAEPGFYNNQISIGMCLDGFCYVWGECNELIVTKPTKSQFKSIDEAVMNYSKYKVTYKPYYFKKSFENMAPLKRIKENFNKPGFRLNDITFKIDGKYIYVQKQYLISVCQHFDTLFSNEWQESKNKEIEITQYSHPVYYSFLKYLYTNSVDIKSKDLIELYYLSDSYFEENLKQKCIEIMRNVINVNNVFYYYLFAVTNNFNDLEKYFFDYIIDHIKHVIKSESFNQMNDISLYRKFISTAVENGNLSPYPSF